MKQLRTFWNSITGLRKQVWILLGFCMPAFVLIVYFYVLYFQSWWRIETHLRAHSQSLPSTVYAESPILRTKMPISAKTLIEYFQRLNYHKHSLQQGVSKGGGEYIVLSNGILFKKRQFAGAQKEQNPIRVEIGSGKIHKLVDTKTSRTLTEYELEPVPILDLFGKEWEKRSLVPYKDIPPHLIQAVIAIEDRRFYQHQGVDIPGIVRAVWNNINDKKSLQGGSTITQQYVKNSFLTPERSIRRKISEAMMASILEMRVRKEKVLELYLNEIYLGQRGPVGIHGVGEASHLYFAKDVQHLTAPEAALLAGIIQAPSAYNPHRHPEEAKNRRNTVLLAMKNLNFISTKQYDPWIKSPVVVQPVDTRINLAPYFGDLVKSQLSAKYDPETIHTRNLSIFTTLNLETQEAAEQALARGLKKIDAVRYSKVKKNIQGCLIAIEPQTGSIRAFVGGRSYSKSQFSRVNQVSRHPGSVFKPVVYAAALERAFGSPLNVRKKAFGSRYFTPATLVQDEPWVLEYANQTWEPKNYDGQYHGTVTLRTALAHSLNVPTARLASAVGWGEIASFAKDLGFSNVKALPSVALGAFEASAWQVAAAYTVFANGGVKTELRTIGSVASAEGKTLESSKIAETRILHPQTAFLMTDMLRSVMVHGTAASSQRSGFTRPAAGKTGTTDLYRDAWFAGYVPQLLCVVWIGYDDNTPIGMNGAQTALPIWLDFMKKVTEKMPVKDFSEPEGMIVRRIDPNTGGLATEYCPVVMDEIFIQGTEPQRYCNEHDSWWSSPFSDRFPKDDEEEYQRPPRRHSEPKAAVILKHLLKLFRSRKDQ